MLPRTIRGRLLVAASLAWLIAPSLADEQEPRIRYSSMINIEAMVSNYARVLARKYDLTEEQDAFTQAFLQENCDAFLAKHREELYDIIDQMYDMRGGGADVTPEQMIEWGQRARPLFEEARELIVRGNDEWRGILTPEQQAIHDADLAQMYDSFTTTEDQLDRIVSGEMTLEEFRRGRPGSSARDRTPAPRQDRPIKSNGPDVAPQEQPASTPPVVRPAQTERHPTIAPADKPSRGREDVRERIKRLREQRGDRDATPEAAPGRADRGRHPRRGGRAAGGTENFESEWEKYVRDFIERYQLNEGQKQRAEAILKDCQEQARSHIAKRKSQLDDLDRRVAALSDADPKVKAKKQAKLNEQKTRLLEPIGRIFESQLKPRLDKLLTASQRAAGEKAGRPTGRPGGEAGKPPVRRPGQRPAPREQDPEDEPEPQPDPGADPDEE